MTIIWVDLALCADLRLGITHFRFEFTFNHLANAFSQSNLQIRTIEAIRPTRDSNSVQVLQ